MRTESYRPLTFVLTAIGGQAGHEGGDYAVQPDWCARIKQQRSAAGHRALAVHVLTYGLTQHATKAALFGVAGLRVPVAAQLAGTAAEVLLHALIDDGRALRWFADTTGKGAFHDLGAPRRVVPVTATGDRVHLVPVDDDGAPVIEHDSDGAIRDAGPHDNPTPATGRAHLDQAFHKWFQIPVGAAVTTGVACWLLHRTK